MIPSAAVLSGQTRAMDTGDRYDPAPPSHRRVLSSHICVLSSNRRVLSSNRRVLSIFSLARKCYGCLNPLYIIPNMFFTSCTNTCYALLSTQYVCDISKKFYCLQFLRKYKYFQLSSLFHRYLFNTNIIFHIM